MTRLTMVQKSLPVFVAKYSPQQKKLRWVGHCLPSLLLGYPFFAVGRAGGKEGGEGRWGEVGEEGTFVGLFYGIYIIFFLFFFIFFFSYICVYIYTAYIYFTSVYMYILWERWGGGGL